MTQDLDEAFNLNKSWALNEEALSLGKSKKYSIVAGHRYCTLKIGKRIGYLFEYTDQEMIEKVKEKMKND